MGARASKFEARSDPQVCVRRHGDPWCPLHRGHNVTSFCSECKILVCLDCITSDEHQGHKFIKFKDCLRDADNKIEERLEDIDKHLISHLDNELSSVTEEIKRREEEWKSKEVQLKNQEKIEQFRRYYEAMIISLRAYETLLKVYKKQLPKEKKKYADIMKSDSDILRYDTGVQLTKDIMDEIQSKPNIPEMTKTKQFDDVMKKLQQEIVRISTTYTDLLYATGASTGMDINLMVTSMFDNESPRYYSATPISADTAWVGEHRYNEHNKKYYNSNKLRLITSTGTVLCIRNFDTNDWITHLSVHPITGLLYCGFYRDRTVRSIDTTTGRTTTVIHCGCRPDRIKVTHDDHVLVSTWMEPDSVYRYKLTVGFVHKSTEKYQVFDIDHCPTSNRVLLSCGYAGVVVLDNRITLMIHTFNGLSGQGRKMFGCQTALFDNSGNIIVGDCDNKEIYILDGKHFSLIHKLHIDGISKSSEIRLYHNTLWVTCREPDKIMCTMLPY